MNDSSDEEAEVKRKKGGRKKKEENINWHKSRNGIKTKFIETMDHYRNKII